MKLRQIVLVTLITFFVASSHSKIYSQEENFATISGILDLPYKDEVTLSKVEHGKTFPIATSKINSKKEFGFNVSPDKEGFYIVGDKDVSVPLYLKDYRSSCFCYR